jgi:hypothetical protein
MLSSSLLEQQHEYRIPDYQAYLAARCAGLRKRLQGKREKGGIWRNEREYI